MIRLPRCLGARRQSSGHVFADGPDDRGGLRMTSLGLDELNSPARHGSAGYGVIGQVEDIR